jgi:two-component system, NarL family, response regulator DesR
LIRTLLALDGTLVRGALALILTAEEDIRVVGEVSDRTGIESAIDTQFPDVVVADLHLIGDRSTNTGRCPLLVLADPRRPRGLSNLLGRHRPIGILGTNVAPKRVVDGVRRLSRGETVVDADLVVAAFNADSPLTERETAVLDIAANGSPVPEIATALGLAPGTVRNHLCRIMRKAGARTRIEAVRVARDAGWI